MTRRSKLIKGTVLAVAMSLTTAGISLSGAPPAAAASTVRIRAVITSNDDGSRPGTVTPAQITQIVNRANTVWSGSGITFAFDPDRDVERIRSTALNNDCTVVATGVCDNTPNQEARDRLALDPNHDGRLTVFFRWGAWHCDPLPCSVRQAGYAFSSHLAHYVVLPNSITGDQSTNTLLAHEVGHYFWLAHTFSGFRSSGDGPINIGEAQEMIRAYVGSGNKAAGLGAFDPDRRWAPSSEPQMNVNDTPPDPGIALWRAVYGSACATANTYTLNVKFDDNTTYAYTLAPDRKNIMSYFGNCWTSGHRLSAEQASRAQYALNHMNRQTLRGAAPTYVQPDQVWTGGWAKGSRVVSFHVNNKPYLFVDRPGTSDAIVLATADGDGNITGTKTVWSGTLGDFTSLMPFRQNGQQYVLAYHAGSGAVRFYRIGHPNAADVGAWTVQPAWSWTWAAGWTHFMPYEINGQPHFIAYKRTTGEFHYDRVRPNAQGIDVLRETGWGSASGITSFMPFTLNGTPHYLAYNAATGDVKFLRFGSGGNESYYVWGGRWITGLTSFMPFDRGPTPRFIAYHAATGDVDIDAINPNAAGITMLKETRWPAGLSTVQALRSGAQWNTFRYGSGTGSVAIDKILQ